MHHQQARRDYHEHAEPFEPFPEGDVTNPDACWDQHPEAPKITRFYQPERQWGDRRVLDFPASGIGPPTPPKLTQQLLDLKFHIPAVVMLRLSSTELTGALTTLSANYVTTWTIDIGCGRALQIKTIAEQIAPIDGSASTDIFLQLPVHALRVSASVNIVSNPDDFVIECVAAAAPFTSFPGMVAR